DERSAERSCVVSVPRAAASGSSDELSVPGAIGRDQVSLCGKRRPINIKLLLDSLAIARGTDAPRDYQAQSHNQIKDHDDFGVAPVVMHDDACATASWRRFPAAATKRSASARRARARSANSPNACGPSAACRPRINPTRANAT